MKLSICILASIVCICPGYAQLAVPDSVLLKASIASTVKLYEKSLEGQHLFFNGSSYVEPKRTGEDHPFFISEDWMEGSINYENNLFTKIPLLYDITSDQLITESYNFSYLALIPEKLKSFDFKNHFFIKIDNETVHNSLPKSGFYEVLYNGYTKIISLHEKQMQTKIESNELKIYFEIRNRYYVLKNSKYYGVKGKSSLLSVLTDQKSTLKSFIRKNHINFKNNREQALSQVAAFYDTLTKK